jgi:hypothetical protein
MGWAAYVSVDEMQRRASGRRRYNKQQQEAAKRRRARVRELSQRWGTSAAAKGKIAAACQVSVRTIARDLQALQERPPVPLLCPTCGLPSRLDVDPTELAALTDDPAVLATLEAAFARLIGAEDPAALGQGRSGSPQTRPKRRQRNDRADARVLALGATTAHG